MFSKIACSISDILPAAKACAVFAAHKTTVPVLEHVVFESRLGRLCLSATDMHAQLSVVTNLPYEGGRFSIAADRFAKFLSSADDRSSVMTIDIDENEKVATLQYGRTRAKYAITVGDTAPLMSKGTPKDLSLAFSSEVLSDALSFCAPAMGKNDVRAFLNGVYIGLVSNEEKMTHVVATDGFRMSVAPTALEALTVCDESHPGYVIVPRETITKLTKAWALFGETVLLEVHNDKVVFSSNDVEVLTTTLSGHYPNYLRVLSEHENVPVTIPVDRAALFASLMRINALDPQMPQATLRFENKALSMHQKDEVHDDAEDQIDIAYEGAEFSIVFNTNYLVDAVQAFHKTDEISLSVRQTKSIMMTCPETGRKHVVMAVTV